jgi:hypothetical protein
MPVHTMTRAADRIVGKPVQGSAARCQTCGYTTVIGPSTGCAMQVHAASCPERGDDRYVACDNIDCRKVLDPDRVQRRKAKTCDDVCRAAAWKQRHNYGRHDPPQSRTNGKPRTSGLQVSYRRALTEISAGLQANGWDAEDADDAAGRWLRWAMSARQRKQLETREQRGTQ